jgi:integrase
MTLFHIRGRVPSYKGVRDLFDRAAKAAGVEDAGLHDIRAKALTDARRQGKDAQVLGGHVDPKMTERYIRLRETPEADPPSFSWTKDATKTA